MDAAEEVVVKRGIGALTLEAVAAEAKVSKGGLLHYFPSKDRLIEALVVRTTNGWREDYTRAIAALPEGPGRVSRALMSMCLAQEEKWNTTMRRSGVVLIAAMASNPKLVQPLRDVYGQLFAMLQKDGLAPGVAEVVALAIDGLWFEWLFGLRDRSPQRMKAIRDALREAVDAAESRRGTTLKPGPRPAKRGGKRAGGKPEPARVKRPGPPAARPAARRKTR